LLDHEDLLEGREDAKIEVSIFGIPKKVNGIDGLRQEVQDGDTNELSVEAVVDMLRPVTTWRVLLRHRWLTLLHGRHKSIQ